MHRLAILTRQPCRFPILLAVAPYKPEAYGDDSMTRELGDCIESDDIILDADLPDETLERAAGIIDGRAVTWIYCTHVWYDCGWPQ
jgi:hypothetical protein